MRITLQALQVREDVRRMLVAKVSVLLQRLTDDSLQLRRHSRIQTEGRGRRQAQGGVKDRRRARARKRLPPRRHLVQHRAKTEQVEAGIKELTPRLRRRHVRHWADGYAAL